MSEKKEKSPSIFTKLLPNDRTPTIAEFAAAMKVASLHQVAMSQSSGLSRKETVDSLR